MASRTDIVRVEPAGALRAGDMTLCRVRVFADVLLERYPFATVRLEPTT
jgi:hypothetical protein